MPFFCIYIIIAWALFALFKPSRKFMFALIPWLLFAIIYDLMRLVPNYEVNPIDVRGIYEAEKELFGVMTAEGKITLGEYFNQHNWRVADFFSGIFYLCWVPVPLGYSIWLFIKKQRKESLKMSIAFLFVNIIGFVIYYIHPAAPPWFVLQYGFEPVLGIPGSVAGLVRFDNLLPFDVFAHIYTGNSNIFAAVPSLHSAYVLTAAFYAVINKGKKSLAAVFMVITTGIWCAAVYTCHHYVIDVLLGIAVAIAAVVLLECCFYRIPCIKRAFERYVSIVE